MRALTYANVMATLAVFVALGGTSIAAVALKRNSVGSRELKSGAVRTSDLRRNAVTTSKVRNGTLLSKDFKAGQLPAGAPGPTGPAGSRGPTGPGGPTGATNVVVRSKTVPLGDSIGGFNLQVTCQPGERAVGGGFVAFGGDGRASSRGGDVIEASGPTIGDFVPATTDQVPTAWAVQFAWQAGANRTGILSVICSSP